MPFLTQDRFADFLEVVLPRIIPHLWYRLSEDENGEGIRVVLRLGSRPILHFLLSYAELLDKSPEEIIDRIELELSALYRPFTPAAPG